MRAIPLTLTALIAFAANSLLCRAALAPGLIDAASFSTIRVASGAVALLFILRLAGGRQASGLAGGWPSSLALFLYMIGFSFAYTSLSAGTGALILFGAVQLTMLLAAIRAGERPPAIEWLGLALAVAGLVYLVLPGVTAPSLSGSLLMAVAGVAWGVYSLLGRSATTPLAHTTGNFLRCVPLVLAVSVLLRHRADATASGVMLAVASGALASGMGYVVWYAALGYLTAVRAATVQLAVPVIAAAGGILLLDEVLSLRLLLASALILGGIGLAVLGRAAAIER